MQRAVVVLPAHITRSAEHSPGASVVGGAQSNLCVMYMRGAVEEADLVATVGAVVHAVAHPARGHAVIGGARARELELAVGHRAVRRVRHVGGAVR